MNKQLVIFGGSSGLAKDLCTSMCREFNIICLSSKKIDRPIYLSKIGSLKKCLYKAANIIGKYYFKFGSTHTNGIIVDIIMAPTTPVNNKVNNGLSEVLNLRVIIK